MNTIQIAYICDNNYAMCTGISIISLKVNRDTSRKYKIYVLCKDVSGYNIKLLNELGEESFDICIHDISNLKIFDKFERQRDVSHVSTSAMFKFGLPDLLPNVSKILYLDGDTLIRDGLSELYDLELSEVYGAVCPDIGAETYPAPFNERLGINHKHYFNTGVLLLNLDLMRKDNIPARLVEYRTTGKNDYMDQDAFNVVFQEKVHYISFLYDMIISGWRRSDLSCTDLNSYYNLNLDNKTQYYENAKILHLTTSDKPWKFNNVIGSEEWMMYYVHSPFIKQFLNRIPRNIDEHQHSLIKGINYSNLSKFNTPEDMPEISVIVPVYNSEKYLIECIDSLMCQSFKNAEFIFVDDGSTDESLQILNRYSFMDPRIKVYTQKNQYAGVARNNGISHASGKYITFLDSDDIMDREALKNLYARAESTDADIVMSAAATFEKSYLESQPAKWCLRTEYMPLVPCFSVSDWRRYLFQISAPLSWSKIFKSDFLKNNDIKFDTTCRSEDILFVYKAFSISKKISYIKNTTIFHRQISGNGSLEDSKDSNPLEIFVVYTHLWENLDTLNLLPILHQSFVNVFISSCDYYLNTLKTDTSHTLFTDNLFNIYLSKFHLSLNDRSYFCFKNQYDHVLNEFKGWISNNKNKCSISGSKWQTITYSKENIKFNGRYEYYCQKAQNGDKLLAGILSLLNFQGVNGLSKNINEAKKWFSLSSEYNEVIKYIKNDNKDPSLYLDIVKNLSDTKNRYIIYEAYKINQNNGNIELANDYLKKIMPYYSDNIPLIFFNNLLAQSKFNEAFQFANSDNGNNFIKGRCFYEGIGTQINKQTGTNLMETYAKGNADLLQELLEIYYKHGEYNDCLRICTQLPDNKISLFRQAQMYRNGKGVEKNLEKASDLMHKAINAGHRGAMKELELLRKEQERANHEAETFHPKKIEESISTLWNINTDNSLKEMVTLCEKIPESRISNLYLARAYYQGKGTIKDKEKGDLLYIKSGNYLERMELLYQDGEYSKVMDICNEHPNNKDCLFRQAQMYRNGYGTKKDLLKAEELMIKAIEAGHKGAVLELENIRKKKVRIVNPMKGNLHGR